jgi:hypothetical protein
MLTSPGVFAQNTVMGVRAGADVLAPEVELIERVPLKITATLSPEMVVAAPGTSQTVKLSILNQSGRVDHFQVQVRGVPREWVTVPDVSADLLPDAADAISIVFNPPKMSSSQAGLYPYEVVLTSVGQPNTTPFLVPGQLRVEPFYGFATDIEPIKLRVHGKVFMKVTNTGNTPQTFNVHVRDREGELNLSFAPDVFNLNPGQAQEVIINAAPRVRAIVGAEQHYSFDAEATDGRPDSQPQSKRVEINVPPVFPNWLIVFSVAALFICVALTLCIGTQAITWSNAQGTANVEGTATTLAGSDADGDGLTYLEERTLGTSPDVSDTDADDLTDWQEARQFGTNPRSRDSDNDTVPDGFEATTQCYSPLNPDTDGDGIRDNADGEPCFVNLPPTAAPPPPPP